VRPEYALAKTSDAVQNRSTADSVVVAAELGSDWGTSATRLNPIAADFWMRSIALWHAESS